MNANKTVTANFTQDVYTLTVISAHGVVTKAPDQATYAYGTEVLLTMGAVDAAGRSRAGASGGCTGTTPCTGATNADTTVTANFTQNAVHPGL